MTGQAWVALRLSLIEQAHNRFAMLLLAAYLPVWYGVIYGLTDDASIGFQLRAFHVFVATTQHRLGLLTGMLNATTLNTGRNWQFKLAHGFARHNAKIRSRSALGLRPRVNPSSLRCRRRQRGHGPRPEY